MSHSGALSLTMFLQHIHNLRTIAIIFLVGTHSMHNLAWPEESLTLHILNILVREASIWFVFISGFLFHYLSDRFDTLTYWRKKALTVILPYIVISAPALYASVTFYPQVMPEGFYTLPLWSQTLLFLATGKHLAPFWFVPAMIIFFMMAPILIKGDREGWLYITLPPLLILSAFIGRDGLLLWLKISGYFGTIAKVVYLLSIYILGMACSRYMDTALDLIRRWWPVLVGIAVLSCLAAHAEADIIGLQMIFLFKLSTCLLLFYGLSERNVAVLDRLAILGHLSFGIYFVHGYALHILRYAAGVFTGSALLPSGIVSYCIVTAAILVACSAGLKLAQILLGKKSRYVFGV